jgi:hypothetical protein
MSISYKHTRQRGPVRASGARGAIQTQAGWLEQRSCVEVRAAEAVDEKQQ